MLPDTEWPAAAHPTAPEVLWGMQNPRSQVPTSVGNPACRDSQLYELWT
jgi:hypothetical protein